MRNLYAYLIASVLFATLVMGIAAAQSTNSTTTSSPAVFAITAGSSLNSYVSTYVSAAAVANSSFYDQPVEGIDYVIMELPGSNNYLVILNQSGSYSFVTNATLAQSVLTPFLTVNFFPSRATISQLNASMRQFMQYSAQNLSLCAYSIGLTQPGNTCTFQNYCFSCQTIPVCKKVLYNLGGVNTTFGLGLINFSIGYNELNESYKDYFNTLGNINQGNVAEQISNLSTIVNNITAAQSTFNQNPVFPPAPGVSYNACDNGLPPTQQPWYCAAVGFCSVIPFNATALNNVRSTLTNLQALLPTTAAITSFSTNASKSAQKYINNYQLAKNGGTFNSLITDFSPQYNSIVANSQTLLQKYNNISLNSSVSVLITEFATIKASGINQSIPVANTILTTLISNATRIYKNASATYAQTYGIAQNNSAALLADQLSYQQAPSELASLSNKQQNINLQLDSQVNSNTIATVLPELQSIRVESAVYVAPVTIGYMIKTVDGTFITALSASGSSYAPQRIASAPLYAAIESLIIGILVILVIYVITYFSVIRKGKLKGNKGAQKKWMVIFCVLIALAIAYTALTYVYATNANNNFLPFGYYINTLKASPTAYIALNGSAINNASIGQCVTTVQSELTALNKNVQTIQLKNYSCVSGSGISTLGINCYTNILSSGDPVIFISQSPQSSIVYKGLYGTVLYASGNATVGNMCVLSQVLRNA